MAKITPKANTNVQIGPCTLVYTPTSAQMLNENGIQVWAISETMFPPSVVGTPPVVSVTVKTTSHTIHPPPPPPGGGLPQIEPHVAGLTPSLEPATTITTTTITITVSGARFAGTDIPADCSMVVTQISNSDDSGTGFPNINYSQTFGSLSFSGQDDDFLGYLTVTAPIPAGNLNLPQASSATLNSGSGLTASIDLAPGYMNLYAGLDGNPVALVSSSAIGNFGVGTLTVAATQGSVVLSFPAPAPAFQTVFTIQQPEGWLVLPPGSATTIGTLSGPASGGSFDTALILAGEDFSANLSFVGLLQLRLSATAGTQTQYTLSLASGLALAGDATGAPVQVSLIGCQLNFADIGTTSSLILSAGFATLNPAPLTTGSIALWPTTGNIAGGVTLDFSTSPATASNAFLNIAQALCSLPDALTRPLPWTGNTGLALVTAPPPMAPEYANYVILGGVAAGATQVVLTGISMEVTRTVDMAIGSFSFQNCGVQQVGGGGLSFVQWGGDPQNLTPFVTVTLPPQHISENAYPLNDDNTPQGTLGPPPVPARMAGVTSLFMELQLEGPTSLTAEMLFDWTNNTLISPQPGVNAQPDPASAMVLELPYRLDLALDPDAGWVQPTAPAPDAATSPLWHARLGAQQGRSDGSGLFVNERSGLQKNARAIWTYDTPGSGSAFADEALTATNREDIVYETGQTNLSGTAIAVDHLILSPLGAWADLRSVWPLGVPPAGHSLSAWTQLISQGRDQYIRAVTVGYLLPWGHVASVVEVAERRFSSDAGNTAYLSTKKYIVVGEVTRTYMQQPNGTPMLRDAVLTQVDLLTQITPAIDQATGVITVPGDGTGPAFVPYVNGQPFLFHARVYDNDQLAQPPRKTADTYLAAIFVDASSSDALITAALNAFNTGSTTAATAQVAPHTDPLPTGSLVPGQISTLSTAVLNGQKLALATSKVLGDTTHAISNLSMQASSLIPSGVPWNLAASISNFYPSLNQALVTLPAVGLLTSAAASNVAVSYLPQYLNPLTDGSNPVDAYMGLASPVAAALSGAKANGLVAPSLAISGLSRTFGALTGDPGNPTAPLAGLLAGALNPASFFPSDAKLLNLIPFTDLVGAVEGLTSFDTTHIPQVKVDTSDPTKIVATMNWLPTLSWPPQTSTTGLTTGGATVASQQNTWNVPGGFVSLTLNGNLAGSITLSSTITTPVTPGPLPGPVPAPIPAGAPVSTMVATVNNFSLNVLDLVQINFDTLTFTSTTGKKPTVKVGLSATPFVLTGQIDFLQVLFDAIEALFDSGPAISVDDAAITLSFEFAVPDVGMGIFDLSGIAIGVDVILSLSTDPVEFHFHYAGPDNPFDLAVDLLGGGGYFLVDASDLLNTAITLSAQAGASVSLDLGVASGSVSIMLGAFFQSSSTSGQGPLLGGYVRADGQLNILDLITLHVSFYLGVTYAPEAGILWGECTVTVEVSVLFFHQSVSLSLRKQFPVKLPSVPLLEHARPLDATPPWPIPRDQIMSPADWTTYTQAFA
jgi:hypothetical protein